MQLGVIVGALLATTLVVALWTAPPGPRDDWPVYYAAVVAIPWLAIAISGASANRKITALRAAAKSDERISELEAFQAHVATRARIGEDEESAPEVESERRKRSRV